MLMTSIVNDPQAPIQVYAQKSMKGLAILQLMLSISITILTVAWLIHWSTNRGDFPSNTNGLWSGVLGIIAASFGIAAVLRMQKRGRCLMITYLVLGIIVCVGMGLVLIQSAIMLHVATSGRYSMSPVTNGFNVTLVVLAAIHFVSTIVSLGLICYNWNRTGGCCGSPAPPPTVLYVPSGNMVAQQQQSAQQQQPQFVVIPVNASQQVTQPM